MGGRGEAVGAELDQALAALAAEVEAGEIKKMLGGEHDRKNAIVAIHPGAGGTESQDWAEMLPDVLRWAERRGLKAESSICSRPKKQGSRAQRWRSRASTLYGLLLAEAGVHRLVRISPFDQAARRHTSFASVRLARAARRCGRGDRREGSPHRHVPLERARRPARQRHRFRGPNHAPAHRHRHAVSERAVAAPQPDAAMRVLKARLFDLRMKEQQAKMEQLGGEKKDIAFGSQIRSYVLHPYQLVKDHRTKEGRGDVDRVLDGDIDPFIKTYLMRKAAGTLGQPTVDEE